jgi:uroporphyrinogen decarboxylase
MPLPMDAKENALRIIRFDHPQRVTAGPPAYTVCYQGCNHEGFDGGGHDLPVGSKWTDIWGVLWRKEHAGVMGFPRGHPLARPQDLKSYRWPDPDDERICGRIYRMHKEYPGGEQFLVGSHRDTIWEKSYMLVGMEDMMAYFHTEPTYAREVLHRIMDFQLGIARHYFKVGVEMISCSDDLGTQIGPLLGPEIVQEFLVPEYRRLFAPYKRRGALINFHSCGRIDSVLGPLMDLGVDILNPVQATANDLEKVRSATAGRMALQGGVSTATIYAGPVEKIVGEVRQRLWQLGREGGYFCCPDQGLPFPEAHLEAVGTAVGQYGHYPLSPPD